MLVTIHLTSQLPVLNLKQHFGGCFRIRVNQLLLKNLQCVIGATMVILLFFSQNPSDVIFRNSHITGKTNEKTKEFGHQLPSLELESSFQPKSITPFNSEPEIGEVLWNQTYGGAGSDIGNEIILCSDENLVVVGTTDSYGAGSDEVWLLKIDPDGNLLWNFTFGGIADDQGASVIECTTGGFLIAGRTRSSGSGGCDVWLIRTDASGNQLWNRTYGGVNDDWAEKLIECHDGTFAIIGVTTSYGAGGCDIWLLRTDTTGDLLWNRTYGGSYDDLGYSLAEWNNEIFFVCGAQYQYAGVPPEPTPYGVIIHVNQTGHDISTRTMWDPGSITDVIVTDDGWAFFAEVSYDTGITWLYYITPEGDYTTGGNFGGYNAYLTACNGGGAGIGGGGWFDRIYPGYEYFGILGTKTLWYSTYPDPPDSNHQINSVVELVGGGFAFAGSVRLPSAESDLWLFRIFEPSFYWWSRPYWTVYIDSLPNLSHEYGKDFKLDVDAICYWGNSYWGLRNTPYFTIDQLGIIRNAMFLPIGLYGCEVWVNDTIGTLYEANFTVSVRDSTRPTWRDFQSTKEIFDNQSLEYQFLAWDLSGIAQWTVSDTHNFTIDETGLLTNVTTLFLGEYQLEIRVYDNEGNSAWRRFTVVVKPQPVPEQVPPIWIPLFVILTSTVVLWCAGFYSLRRTRKHTKRVNE